MDKALEIINNSEIHTIPNEISNTNIKSGYAVSYLGYGVMLIIGYIYYDFYNCKDYKKGINNKSHITVD